MAYAARVVREAGELLIDPTTPESATADAQQHLDFEMSHEPAVSNSATWIGHVDEHIISMVLVDRHEGPVVSAVCRPWTNELLCASLDGGAYCMIGEGAMTPVPECGMASIYANVVHVPHAKCPEVDMALDELADRMPMNVTRVECCCCCEGLFELVSGRADVHLSPPEYLHLGQQRTPVPVLAAFAVLLGESGGHMSDIHGNEIDLVSAVASGDDHREGIVASESATHNYIMHAIRRPFHADRLLLPRLSEKLQSSMDDYRVEYVDMDSLFGFDNLDDDDGSGAELELPDSSEAAPSALEEAVPSTDAASIAALNKILSLPDADCEW